jgi:hypothetical protein
MTSDIMERAYQLASECESVVEVRNRLRREGFFHVDAHLAGQLIKSALKQKLKRRVEGLPSKA